jgi:K+-transporting ATPase ATPase C chain
MVILWTVLTGLLYPLAVTGVAQVCFPSQANGSLLADGKGSSLIGQEFTDPKYFWGRPSAITKTETGKDPVSTPYDASNSMGSNFGTKEPKEADLQKAAVAHFTAANPPTDLITASASGLDPHISPEAAMFQVPRVAKARHLDEAKLRVKVAQFTQGKTFGVLGAPRVNVLLLNRALDGF